VLIIRAEIVDFKIGRARGDQKKMRKKPNCGRDPDPVGVSWKELKKAPSHRRPRAEME
jgi:hypothetical protein